MAEPDDTEAEGVFRRKAVTENGEHSTAPVGRAACPRRRYHLTKPQNNPANPHPACRTESIFVIRVHTSGRGERGNWCE